MGGTHNALSRGPWGRALKDALGDSRAEGALERYGETMQPTINLWAQPEWSFLRGEHLWACSIVRAGDAANQSVVGVGLPNNSRNIVVVEGISGRNSVGGGNLVVSMIDRPTFAALGGFVIINPPFFRDQRADPIIGAQRAPLEAYTALNGAGTINGTIENLVFPAGEIRDKKFNVLPLIIKPGGVVFVQGVAINQQIVVSFWGRVRSALPTELKS